MSGIRYVGLVTLSLFLPRVLFLRSSLGLNAASCYIQCLELNGNGLSEEGLSRLNRILESAGKVRQNRAVRVLFVVCIRVIPPALLLFFLCCYLYVKE